MSPHGTYEGTPRLNAETTNPSHEPRKIYGGIPPGVRIAVILLFLLVVIGVAYRLLSHASAEHQLKKATDANAVPTVSITHPTVTGASDELALPGNTQAFDDTPIYARTSGYLKKWFVDIGAHVRQGELMATIETPELDEQLMVARAELKSAQAELNLANTTSERYQNLLKQDSVSRQETDVAVSGAAAKLAAVEAAQAAVRRLEQLQSFEKVYAPYSGVVTQRNTDIGDLIDAGSPTTPGNAKELYRIASVNELRVFVAVPEVYSPDIHNGDTATLTLDEYPGQTFTGTVARNSNAIDSSSRTLNVEVDVDNKDGKLLPGAYVFVHFKIPVQSQLLSVPSNALIFRSEGMQVAIVRDGKVHLQHVAIAKDNGKSVEIANGLGANDAIILNPSDSIAEGQQVDVSSSGAQ
jgi:RND family efflux transporter MFP subunit